MCMANHRSPHSTNMKKKCIIDWDFYQSDKPLKVKAGSSKEIIKTFSEGLSEFFNFPKQGKIPCRTRWVKDKLAVLGDKKEYKVYANGLSQELKPSKGGAFKIAEWLYDLHWYTEGEKDYTTKRLPLVLECEWQSERQGDPKKKFSGIKYDFQKLLVTNAEFRLLVFRIIRTRDYKSLTNYFEENIISVH
jgi:hypothetical protein